MDISTFYKDHGAAPKQHNLTVETDGNEASLKEKKKTITWG